MTIKLAAVALILAVAAPTAGCGSEDSSDSYTPEASTTMTVAEPPLTEERFVRRVNAICREAWVTVFDNWEVHTRNQDPKLSKRERFEEAVRASLISGIVFHIFDNIRDLGAPSGEDEEIEEIIGPFQIAAELGWDERWRAYSTADVAEQFATYNERAEDYGLDDCLVTAARLRPISAN